MNREEQVTIDGDKVWLWFGHPYHKDSTKIDVTIPFNIGLAIGSKEFDKIHLADKYTKIYES